MQRKIEKRLHVQSSLNLKFCQLALQFTTMAGFMCRLELCEKILQQNAIARQSLIYICDMEKSRRIQGMILNAMTLSAFKLNINCMHFNWHSNAQNEKKEKK